MKPIKHSLTLSIACVFALALPACSGLRSAASGPGAEASPAPSGRTLATPRADGRTAEGGFVDGFAFAEKPGDVTLNPVSFSSGTVRADRPDRTAPRQYLGRYRADDFAVAR